MPYNTDEKEFLTREWMPTSDDNLIAFAKNIARAYHEIGVLTEREYNAAMAADDIDAINDIISEVPNMDPERRQKFCISFVGNDTENFNGATPAILADAYRGLASRDRSESEEEMFQRIGEHIDNLSMDFANTGGMYAGSTDWPVVDTNNIADVYEGFSNMLNARRDELMRGENAENNAKIAAIDENLNRINGVVHDYDEGWGIADLKPADAPGLESRWDDLMLATSRAQVTDANQEIVSNVKFLDDKNRVIPQFVDANGEFHDTWEPGMRIDKNGRLGAVWDLACHDVAKKNVAKLDQEINEDQIEADVNDEFLTKLYEIGVADKIVQGAIKDPDAFSRPESREQLIAELTGVSGKISDAGFNAAIDAQTNATAGWATRVKAKLGNAARKTRGFFAKVFRPLQRIDRLGNARLARDTVDKRSKRRELFARVLKGFASAFVASALITTIATAAAAVAGVSVAMGLAAIGMITAIGMGVVQIMRWRRAQQEAGLPTDIHALLADKRLVLSLGTSAIAVLAMCFGAAGMATAAQVLGYGALAMGGTKNTVEAYRDARDSGMSRAESLAWGLASAGAVVAGGLTGRYAANTAINAFNRANPTNRIFQNEAQRTEQRMVEDTREVTETRTEYTQQALDRAENIVKMWYRDNPDILQHRVDAINAYNAEHGTSVDPYRALLVNGDAGGRTFDDMLLHVNHSHADPNINDVHSGGMHKVFGPGWAKHFGVSNNTIDSAAHLFNADGTINPDGMDAVAYLDNYVNWDNTVGHVISRSIHNDNFLHQNDIVRDAETSPNGRVYSAYAPGESAFRDVEYIGTETYTRPEDYIVTDYTRAHGNGMAMFGNYNPRGRKGTLRDRIGAFADRIHRHFDRTPTPAPVPQKQLPEGSDKEPKLLGTGGSKPKQLPVGSVKEPKPLGPRRPAPKQLKVAPVKEPNLLGLGRPESKQLNVGRVEPVELQYAIEYQDAKDYNDLTKNIIREYKKKHPDYTKIKRLEQKQKELWNDLGRPDMITFDRVRREAYQRRELIGTIEELSDMSARRPQPGFATKNEILDWEHKYQRLEQKVPELGTLHDLARAIDELNATLDRFGRDGTVPADKVESFIKKRDLAMKYLVSHGGAELLNTSSLYFPSPTKSKSRIVKEERNARSNSDDANLDLRRDTYDNDDVAPETTIDFEPIIEPEYVPITESINKQERFVPVEPMVAESKLNKKQKRAIFKENKEEEKNTSMSQKVEKFNLFGVLKRAIGKVSKNDRPERTYFVPDSLEQLVSNANLIDTPITSIRGVPVHLMDLGGNGNPITQNFERPMVVIEIKQASVLNGFKNTDLIRVPFHLVTGLEKDSAHPTGHWYPLQRLYPDGNIFDGKLDCEELSQIGKALDSHIGDIRNWSYGDNRNDFIGGSDVMQHIEPKSIIQMLGYSVYDNHYLYTQVEDYASIDPELMVRALSKIKSQDWDKQQLIAKISAHLRKVGIKETDKVYPKMIQMMVKLFGDKGSVTD